MEEIKKIDKRICYDLQEMTNRLVSNIENLINEYEEATGMSIRDARITFDERTCKSGVRLLIDYYNFDNSMVRTEE